MNSSLCFPLLLGLSLASAQTSNAPEPLRLGIAGLVHGHASGFLSRYLTRQDIQLVGFAEPDQTVASRYANQFKLDRSILYASVDQMLDRARPQAVVIFTTPTTTSK